MGSKDFSKLKNTKLFQKFMQKEQTKTEEPLQPAAPRQKPKKKRSEGPKQAPEGRDSVTEIEKHPDESHLFEQNPNLNPQFPMNQAAPTPYYPENPDLNVLH